MLWQAPARLIANNAGVEGDVIVEKLLGQPWEMGYNAMDDRIEDLMEAGIIDPAKVTLLVSLWSRHVCKCYQFPATLLLNSHDSTGAHTLHTA